MKKILSVLGILFLACSTCFASDMRIVQVDGLYYSEANSSKAEKVIESINKLNASLTQLITSVNCAMNIVVIKTHAGMAQAVATGIDNIKSDDILGCVAGDDTIFVVTTNTEIALEIGAKIKYMMTEGIR